MRKYNVVGRRGNFTVWKDTVEAEDAEMAGTIAAHNHEHIKTSFWEVTSTTTIPDLPRCGKCGGEPEFGYDRTNPTFDIWVQCQACGIRTRSDDSHAGARSEWLARNYQTKPYLSYAEIAEDEPPPEIMAGFEVDEFLYELLYWLKDGDRQYTPNGCDEGDGRVYLCKEYIQQRASELLGDSV